MFLWLIAAAILMLGAPWLTVAFAGSAGMALCLLLFFVADPLFCVACGILAGQNVKKRWFLPIVSPALFLLGTWLFFDMGNPDFLFYTACYLLIGLLAILVRAILKNRK